jgi:hypothetical protein
VSRDELDPEANRRFSYYKVRPGVWDKFRDAILSRKLGGVLAEDVQGKVGKMNVRRLNLRDERSSVRVRDLLDAVLRTPGSTAFRVSTGGEFDDVIVGNRKEVRAWIDKIVVEAVMGD